MFFGSPTLQIASTEHTTEQLRVIRALKERRMFKLICGATYSDFEAVARYTEIFSLAGVHMIDLCAHPTIVNAARETLDKINIPADKRPALMVSLSLDHQMDPHFKRVSLDSNSCDSCGACIPTCPTQAFSIKDASLNYAKEKCYGCGACVPVCHVDALQPEPMKAFQPAILPELWDLGARCLEIHVGPNFYWLESYLHKIKEISPQPWLFSVCIGSGFASYRELQEQTNEIYNILGEGTLIQIDGKAMSGFVRHDAMMLQALAGAQAVLDVKKPVYVQISGGVNDRVRDLMEQFSIRAHGVGMGSFAKKQIEPYINDLETSVKIAKRLIESIRVF
ncbi:MAG TPA: LdpA C-terminal domain-containing domain [Vampirovibrionales bacterium]